MSVANSKLDFEGKPPSECSAAFNPEFRQLGERARH
jgi:hypothetical protein